MYCVHDLHRRLLKGLQGLVRGNYDGLRESRYQVPSAHLHGHQLRPAVRRADIDLDLLCSTFTDEKIARWDERLKTVFNRGFWDGYYLGQRLGEWTKNYGSAATERKIYVGKGIRYFSNIGVAEFLVEAAEVSVGDKLLITGPTTGAEFVTLDEARVDLKPVQTVKKGQHFSMKSVKIRPSDKLYKLVSVEELKKFKGLDVEKQRG